MTIIKSDGRREPFDKNKLVVKLQMALNKRPISMSQIEEVADRIEADLIAGGEKEIAANPTIGELVMQELKKLDEVAYVRFASVYRQFKDLRDFENELRQLVSREN